MWCLREKEFGVVGLRRVHVWSWLVNGDLTRKKKVS